MSISSRNTRDYEAVGPGEVEAWMFNLRNLCRQTIVYPSPDQMILRGSKLYVIDQLRKIAREVTHTDYPEVVLIDNPQDPSLADRPGVFMKRSFSDTAAHVLRVCDAKAAVYLPAMVKDTKAFYDHDAVRKMNVVPEWFGMAFVPEMSQKGEIKAFFIGGHLTHIISTAPSGSNLEIAQVFELTPLRHLSYVLFRTKFISFYSSHCPQENRRRARGCHAFDNRTTRFRPALLPAEPGFGGFQEVRHSDVLRPHPHRRADLG